MRDFLKHFLRKKVSKQVFHTFGTIFVYYDRYQAIKKMFKATTKRNRKLQCRKKNVVVTVYRFNWLLMLFMNSMMKFPYVEE